VLRRARLGHRLGRRAGRGPVRAGGGGGGGRAGLRAVGGIPAGRGRCSARAGAQRLRGAGRPRGAGRERRARGAARALALVAALALAEECPETDALTDAECLGDWADGVITEAGRVARLPVDFGAAKGAQLAWHALGAVHSPVVECPGCGALYADDDEAAALPVCPACGVADTWEARQGAGFRAHVAEIDGCASLAELAALGKRLYALALAHDQAGVAWSHHQPRKAALEAAIVLGASARALIVEVQQAPARALPRLGARLYRLQQGSAAAAVTAREWWRIWAAYRARKAALAA